MRRNIARAAVKSVHMRCSSSLPVSGIIVSQTRTFKDDVTERVSPFGKETPAERRFHMLQDLKLIRALVDGLRKTHSKLETKIRESTGEEKVTSAMKDHAEEHVRDLERQIKELNAKVDAMMKKHGGEKLE